MDNNVEKVDLDHVDWKSSREFFESLGEALDKLDDKDESYNFTWVGKRKSIVEAGAPINKTLRPDVEASKNFNDTKNMLIVGDNLDALKLLQESYLGKIKMIYIDPPYNTGHDFVYHDNFRTSNYEDNSVDNNGNIVVAEDPFRENSKSNGKFHSDWLSMLYPRLRLSRNLLSEDGIFFVSIDDNEQANLKKLCDEIFGEDNFVCDFIWKSKPQGGNDNPYIVPEHEYILAYAKSIENLTVHGRPINPEKYKNRDEYYEERGGYALGKLDLATLGYRSNLDYPIDAPDGTKIYPGGVDYDGWQKRQRTNTNHTNDWRWRWSKERLETGIKNGFIEIMKNKAGKWGVYAKEYQKVDRDGNKIDRELKFRTIIDDVTSVDGTKEVAESVGKRVFSFPKPIKLMQRFVEIGANNDSIILDFFAGSGSIGESIISANSADNGNRKFIMVQLDEPTPEISDARKNGFERIDQITAERLRRAGDKIANDEIDTGFRVFRIDETNEKNNIRKPLSKIGQSDLFSAIDNVKRDRTPLDLLFGIVYISALPFDLKLKTRKIGENTVYLYGYFDEGTGLVACFDNNIPEETIKEIASLKALTAAFKDSSFVDSAAKINLSEHFRIISPDTKVKVL